ncbi:cytoskeletal protein CcmA (bactofilin family) [Kushneria sinocarnis]|uniref:Cytoskeletal protein CcmA (Bactofilin family) n=1 Tax=Kushneria sinocarnis TaxID=595502 RepID=A0A420WXH0_9GAMM|nr:polymer-forming cytoskeletal protein [Kushneria sinocarnis]RKR04461.1 cytoskeletal protein CcmA (bactofilin family) [Kushneria sinocarnis]
MFHRTRSSDETGEHPAAADSAETEVAAGTSSSTARIGKRSLIGSATRITGDVAGEEDLHVEGEITGSVTFSRHAVGVGVSGVIEGDVVAQSLTVAGRVEGRLIASESIRVVAGARVNGELHSPGLVIEEGAEFQGTVDMNPANPLLKTFFDTLSVAGDATGSRATASVRQLQPVTPLDDEQDTGDDSGSSATPP